MQKRVLQVGSLGGYEKVDLNLLGRLIDSTIEFDSKLEEKQDKLENKTEEKTDSALPTAGKQLQTQTLQNLILDRFIPELSLRSWYDDLSWGQDVVIMKYLEDEFVLKEQPSLQPIEQFRFCSRHW